MNTESLGEGKEILVVREGMRGWCRQHGKNWGRLRVDHGSTWGITLKRGSENLLLEGKEKDPKGENFREVQQEKRYRGGGDNV